MVPPSGVDFEAWIDKVMIAGTIRKVCGTSNTRAAANTGPHSNQEDIDGKVTASQALDRLCIQGLQYFSTYACRLVTRKTYPTLTTPTCKPATYIITLCIELILIYYKGVVYVWF